MNDVSVYLGRQRERGGPNQGMYLRVRSSSWTKSTGSMFCFVNIWNFSDCDRKLQNEVSSSFFQLGIPPSLPYVYLGTYWCHSCDKMDQASPPFLHTVSDENENEVWEWGLGMRLGYEAWEWGLRMRLGNEVWEWGLSMRFENEAWEWGLRMRFENEAWEWGLGMRLGLCNVYPRAKRGTTIVHCSDTKNRSKTWNINQQTCVLRLPSVYLTW